MGLLPFEEIVAEHGATVLRVCRAVLGGRAEAEDAWSETFLAALKAYPRLDAQTNIQAWLVTIAKRKAIDQHRAAARGPVPLEQLPEPTRRLEHESETADGVMDALASLPPKQREAIAYHHLAGLPYAEVAAILGNSEAAARRAAADGMRTLRMLYSERTR